MCPARGAASPGQPGWLLSEYAAKRGIPGNGSVAFACPGAAPRGLRRLRAADFDYFDDSDIKNNAAMALPWAPASNRERQEALLDGGDTRWPSLPPATAAILVALAMPAAANRHQRRAAAASRCNTARVAGALAALAARFSGSHQGRFGAPGMGGDTSPSALALQALLSAESWADLMDADDASAEMAARRDRVAPSPGLDIAGFWDSCRVANCVVAGASGVPGAGVDASAGPQGAILDLWGSRQRGHLRLLFQPSGCVQCQCWHCWGAWGWRGCMP